MDDIGCWVGLDDGIVVFKSDDSDGVFADVGGGLARIAAKGDVVDAKLVESTLFIGDYSVDGRDVLLGLDFAGLDDDGLYLATFPRGS